MYFLFRTDVRAAVCPFVMDRCSKSGPVVICNVVIYNVLGRDDATTWHCSTFLMCNLRANSNTLIRYFEEVVLGSICIQLSERLVAYCISACPLAMAVHTCKPGMVFSKRPIWNFQLCQTLCSREATVARLLLPTCGLLLGPGSDVPKKPSKPFIKTQLTHSVCRSVMP